VACRAGNVGLNVCFAFTTLANNAENVGDAGLKFDLCQGGAEIAPQFPETKYQVLQQ